MLRFCALKSLDRQTDFGGQAYAPRQSQEFFVANGVSCSIKHTLLCSGEHNNPLLKRILHIVRLFYPLHLPLVSFAGAKLLRQIRLGNSHQPPLAATLQTNAVRDYAFVNEWVHECIELSIFPLLEALKFQISGMSNHQGTELAMFWCLNTLIH